MKVAVFLLCVMVSADVAAQSAFVEGGFSADIRRFSHDQDGSPFDGTVNGLRVAGAGVVARRWSIGVELDVAGESSTAQTVTVPISGRPAQVTTTYTSRRRALSALAGFHTPFDRPVQVGCYVGLSFTVFRREIASDAPAIVLQEPVVPTVFDEHVSGALVGVDAAIRIAPHFAVVPALRAQGLSLSGDLTGFSIRPSIGARITF